MRAILSDHPDGAVIEILCQPGAVRNELVGVHSDALKIRLSAPPERGRANRMLCGYVAEVLGVSRGDVRVQSGTRSRRKRLLVVAKSAKDVLVKVADALHRQA
ncbi:MAG: DUF167 domain-containing protein [Actinobacteria bacterium]|nr:MAG: DUF167 domain-containing protein [Actinomycetota bacterium]RIK06640.1 MAG: hypothetical protein DCC48_06295 [Acidobacteriota bacterium]